MRKTYVDNIRWITVVLVVIYHVIFMFNGIETTLTIGALYDNQPQDAYMYLVYPWFMLILFIVSGMCSRFYLEGHTDKEFRKSRTTKLLVPSTIGLFVFQWILGYYNTINGELFAGTEMPIIVKYLIWVVSGQGVLWYIQLLWVFSMLLLLVRKFEKGKIYAISAKANILVMLALGLLVFLSAQVLNMPYIVVYRFGIYGVGFFLGYFVFAHDEVIDSLSKWWIILDIAAVIMAVIFTKMYWGQNYAGHEVLDTVMCNAYAWVAILAIFATMNKFGNFDNAFSRWMGKKSWGLYVFHYLYIAIVAVYTYGKLPGIVVYLLSTVAAFACSYVTYEIFSRIPFIRWAVLGIKKK